MGELRFEKLPYDEEGILRYMLVASSNGFSGVAELYQIPATVKQFGNALMAFPKDIQDTVDFKYGDDSGQFPYHVVLRAKVMDRSGHSAIFVHIQSFCSPIEAAICEFLVSAEPAAINELGRQLSQWSTDANEPIVWQPRA